MTGSLAKPKNGTPADPVSGSIDVLEAIISDSHSNSGSSLIVLPQGQGQSNSPFLTYAVPPILWMVLRGRFPQSTLLSYHMVTATQRAAFCLIYRALPPAGVQMWSIEPRYKGKKEIWPIISYSVHPTYGLSLLSLTWYQRPTELHDTLSRTVVSLLVLCSVDSSILPSCILSYRTSASRLYSPHLCYSE